MRFIRSTALLAAITFSMGAGAALAEGDATKGEKIFKKCKACHSTEEGKKKIGPSLFGIIGRTAGTVEGFKYSKAMVAYGESGVSWSSESLDEFLSGPKKVVKGTKMVFPGLKKPEDRANVIAYLDQFK